MTKNPTSKQTLYLQVGIIWAIATGCIFAGVMVESYIFEAIAVGLYFFGYVFFEVGKKNAVGGQKNAER